MAVLISAQILLAINCFYLAHQIDFMDSVLFLDSYAWRFLFPFTYLTHFQLWYRVVD